MWLKIIKIDLSIITDNKQRLIYLPKLPQTTPNHVYFIQILTTFFSNLKNKKSITDNYHLRVNFDRRDTLLPTSLCKYIFFKKLS